jgi:predicted DNA-binding transcriptional regulator YafY
MKVKAEEIIPDVLRRLSRGEALSTAIIMNDYKVSRSSFNERFKDVREVFYSRFISYDKDTEKWIGKPKFLETMFLTPEEAVILTAIIRKKKEFGDKLSDDVDQFINRYLKRTKTSVYKQNTLEEINASMEIKFAQLKYAIEHSKKISFRLYKNTYEVIPYKIINLEFYWYLMVYEISNESGAKSEKVKTYTIKNINDLTIHEDTVSYDFSGAEKKLENAMNAYFDVSEKANTIELLIIDWFVPYIKRAKYFSGWKETGAIDVIDKKNYHVYEVESTHENFLDVIPTILMYAPKIIIRDNDDITKEIFSHLEQFAKLHSKTITDTFN